MEKFHLAIKQYRRNQCMINKIRKIFGLRQRITIHGVKVYLPNDITSVAWVEMKGKSLCHEKTKKIVQYMYEEGFISRNYGVYVATKST